LKERLNSILINLGGLFTAVISYTLISKILTISNIPQQVSTFISTLTLMTIGYILYKKYNLIIGRVVLLVTVFLLFISLLARPL